MGGKFELKKCPSGKSEMYASDSGMENGIASVKKNGLTADVVGNT